MRKNYAVIAAGGLGTRLKDYKHNESTKVLIDIGGLSMISSQVMQLKSWGFSDFIVITNPDFNDLIKNDLQKNFVDENISYVIQPSPKGIADALSYAEAEIDKNSPVLPRIIRPPIFFLICQLKYFSSDLTLIFPSLDVGVIVTE